MLLRQRFLTSLYTALALMMSALAAMGCTRPAASSTPTPPPPSPTPSPAPAPTPRAIQLPQDEAAHANQLEWWYYNGHLEDEKGGRYGFHFVVFQARGQRGQAGYIGNLGITDLGRGEHVAGFQSTGNPQPQPPQGFAFSLADWKLEGDRSHAFRGVAAEGYALDLTMTPTKPAALHNEIGWLNGPDGWTYYYSWTRMTAHGVLKRGEESIPVRGSAWMDHQWGDFMVRGYPSGWQWLALQLDDGSDLMINELRDGHGGMYLYGTLVAPDGKTEHLTAEKGLAVDVLGQWRSPHTGADYPAGWRLRVPHRRLEFELQPAVADQEIAVAFPPSAIYWEGVVNVTGRRGGAPLGGKGYVELVGYVRVPGL